MHGFICFQLSAVRPHHVPNILKLSGCRQTFASDSEYLCQMTYLNLPLYGTVTRQHRGERKQFAISETHVHSAFVLKGAPTVCNSSWNCNMKAAERTYFVGSRAGNMPQTSRSANKEHEKPVCMKLIGGNFMCIFTYCFQGNSMLATHTHTHTKEKLQLKAFGQ